MPQSSNQSKSNLLLTIHITKIPIQLNQLIKHLKNKINIIHALKRIHVQNYDMTQYYNHNKFI